MVPPSARPSTPTSSGSGADASVLVPVSRYVFARNTQALHAAEALEFVTRRILRERCPTIPSLDQYFAVVHDCYDHLSMGMLLSRTELEELLEHGALTPAGHHEFHLTPDTDEPYHYGSAWMPEAMPESLFVKFKRSRVRHRAVFTENLSAFDTIQDFQEELFTWSTVGEGFAHDTLTTGVGRMDMLVFGSLTTEDIAYAGMNAPDAAHYGPLLLERGIPTLTLFR